MNRWYIYKLTFMNGCTYVGKHHQVCEKDKYITSSSYYHKKGGKDILLKREIVLDNLPDSDICDIMETICILHDRAENINNVNYNKGAWVSNQFDRGFSGKENGMYGRSVESIVGKERWQEIVKNQKEGRSKKYEEYKKSHNGFLPHEYKSQKQKEYNKHIDDINYQIRKARGYYDKVHFDTKEELQQFQSKKASASRWYWNPITFEETFSKEAPIGWNKGRLPHKYWSEERKQSYAEKHKINTIERMTCEAKEERSRKISETNKGRICFTNGEINVYLLQGQNVPDGFWKGCTFEKTEKYINSRKKKGYNNKGEKINE